jgi:hypothetical protein
VRDAVADLDEVEVERCRLLQPRQCARAKELAVAGDEPVFPPVLGHPPGAGRPVDEVAVTHLAVRSHRGGQKNPAAAEDLAGVVAVVVGNWKK